jgi:Flp pilus assembly protein TadD
LAVVHHRPEQPRRRALLAGKIEEAEAEFRAAIAARPNAPPSYGNLGIALREQGRFDEAVAAYRIAIRIRPDHGPLHMGLALVHEGAGRTDQALVEARNALRLAPADDEVLSAGRMLFLRLGRLDEAAALIDDDPGALDRAELHFLRGNVLVADERFDEAVVAFRRAVALGSKDPFVYANLGAALASLGRLGEAVDAFTEALRLNPDLTEVRNNLGLALDLLDSGGGLFNGVS